MKKNLSRKFRILDYSNIPDLSQEQFDEVYLEFIREDTVTLSSLELITQIPLESLYKMLDKDSELWYTVSKDRILILYLICRMDRIGRFLLFSNNSNKTYNGIDRVVLTSVLLPRFCPSWVLHAIAQPCWFKDEPLLNSDTCEEVLETLSWSRRCRQFNNRLARVNSSEQGNFNW